MCIFLFTAGGKWNKAKYLIKKIEMERFCFTPNANFQFTEKQELI